ncbi:MAG: hypothetical protein RBT55_03470 [Rhodocyclaceae bacterium]|jgi:hypothetical protein|nr:hypothetical protein [Rhodocyclaceae bacterium]
MAESDHERIRRLIQERMAQQRPPQHFNCRSSLGPIFPGLRMLAMAIFAQAYKEAIIEQREAEAGIPDGPADAPGSWDGLEAALGKEAVDRMRRGGK